MTYRPVPDPSHWTPCRYIGTDQVCAFCGVEIPRAKPGTTTGTRGTKAWFNEAQRRWECLACRNEATRADISRRSSPPPDVVTCASCGFSRVDVDLSSSEPIFGLRLCAGCDQGGKGHHRICPKCGHIEHRSYGAQAREVAA